MRARSTVAVIALLGAAVSGCDRSRLPWFARASVASTAVTGSELPAANDPVYMCPMDRDVRSHEPGKCPKCGMALVAGVPDPVEYHLDLDVNPVPQAGSLVHLNFQVHDPWKDNLVTKFTIVHEKLFHAFVVSRDLQFFVHGHPEWNGNSFQYDIKFPRPGMYRILGDFYPEASTPQLLTQTVFVAGDEPPAQPLTRDYSAKEAENTGVELVTSPEQPVAGVLTQMRFRMTPADGMERYLGVWAHMLAASDDLIDMMHRHPALADGGAEMQFNVLFPRARTYRVWIQFQRNGVVNTVHFDVPVQPLPEGPIAAAATASPSPQG
jgi:hypothetical protein